MLTKKLSFCPASVPASTYSRTSAGEGILIQFLDDERRPWADPYINR